MRLRRALAGAAALALCAGAAAAQETGNSNGGAVIGPPQLKDFSLTPRERIVTQPRPTEEAPPPPAPTPAPARAAERPSEASPPPAAARQAPARAEAPAPPRAVQPEAPALAAPTPSPAAREASAPLVPAVPTLPAQAEAAAAPPPPLIGRPQEEAEGSGLWYYALPAAALALFGGGVAVRRRRRRAGASLVDDETLPEALAERPPEKAKPGLDHGPRPWIELDIRTGRASLTAEEASIEFELTIRNSGDADARDVRINARIFNAGAEQDREIGAFFTSRGEGRRTFSIPHIPAGVEGAISGSVAIPREEMRAVQLQDRLLFIPVVGVNAVYDYGEDRTGQTSKSYVVGRDLGPEAEKMGPFRVDQGPRVWRSVGHRPHRMVRRV